MISNSKKIKIYDELGFQAARAAGKIVATVLDEITPYLKPGISTGHIDEICVAIMEKHGARPAALGYMGFPKSICTSVNHVVCHGIPSHNHILNEGDIINIDAAVIYEEFYGDSARMYWIGKKIPIKAQNLTIATYDAMMKAIACVKPGAKINDIGTAIQNHVTQYGYSVVRDFCGHGVGHNFHEYPSIMHYKASSSEEPEYCDLLLQEGMIFTIEPMINAGKYDVKLLNDGWTAVTKDRSLSAQFEHMIGVTKNGCEIFTVSPSGMHFPPYSC